MLAPMANITTYPFASQAIEFGADIVWTPMVHTDTILNNWPEAKKILDFNEIPNYIIQIVGSDKDKIVESINIIEKKLQPLGIDLNFACPDKNIIKSGCGGAMMQKPDEILNIVREALIGSKIPISIKIRSGWDNPDDIYNLMDKLTNTNVSFVTIHPRTVKQGFKGKADWEIIEKLVDMYPNMPIIGSGDIITWKEALSIQRKAGCKGVMLGRGALGKPWIFKEIKDKKDYIPSLKEIKRLALDLSEKSYVIWGERGIIESRKHLAWYFKGFPSALKYRKRLMAASTIADLRSFLN